MSTLENQGLKQIFKKSHGSLKALFLFSLLFIISSCGGNGSDGGTTSPTNGNPLTALSVSGISLSPSFSPTVNSYTATVPFSTNSITLQASVISGASVTVNGVIFSGSGTFDLTVGSNVFSIVVINSGTSQTYTVTITREAISSDASLNELAISSGSLSPVFTPQTLTYGVSVDNETTSITVTPTSNDSNASIAVNGAAVNSGSASGAIVLTVGDNVIDVVVTAEDGATTQTYTVTITRLAPLSNDANLSSLSLSVGSLNPVFNTATLTYSASVNFTTTSITVTPVLSDTNASVTVNGTLTNSGAASDSINLDEGDNTISLVVLAEDDTTAQTYTVVVTRQAAAAFAQQAYIKASNAEIADEFGYSVSLDGDTLAVGAFHEDGDDTNGLVFNSGAVYVFTRTDGTWAQQAYIQASNAGRRDSFGISVALDGDTLAVGASGEASDARGIGQDETNNQAADSGAVYVFTRSAGVWAQRVYIKSSNSDFQDGFGISVALDGDILAVGATQEDSGAAGIGQDEENSDALNSGAVYVFSGAGSNWIQQAYIKASNTNANDSFGQRVALNGGTLAISAQNEGSDAIGIGGDEANNNAAFAGAVYVFTRNGSIWTQQAYIKASNTEPLDFFGWSIAIDGDTLAVGAFGESSNSTSIGGDEENNNATGSGAVYLFTRNNNSWSQQVYIKASNALRNDNFGSSVALNGNNLAVGANHQDTGSEFQSGAAYVFTRSGSSWTEQTFIKASTTGQQDWFGNSIALDGDTLVVGANGEASNSTGIDGNQGDNSAASSGAIYVFEVPPSE